MTLTLACVSNANSQLVAHEHTEIRLKTSTQLLNRRMSHSLSDDGSIYLRAPVYRLTEVLPVIQSHQGLLCELKLNKYEKE